VGAVLGTNGNHSVWMSNMARIKATDNNMLGLGFSQMQPALLISDMPDDAVAMTSEKRNDDNDFAASWRNRLKFYH
jgi:hypothetical protein